MRGTAYWQCGCLAVAWLAARGAALAAESPRDVDKTSRVELPLALELGEGHAAWEQRRQEANAGHSHRAPLKRAPLPSRITWQQLSTKERTASNRFWAPVSQKPHRKTSER